MRCLSSRPVLGLGLLLVFGASGGCRPKLPVDPDGVLYYFRNARVQGEVRRVWPEGQRYVDQVLRADAQLLKELNALLVWQRPDALWPHDDPRWQDADALATPLERLRELARGRAEPRQQLLAKLKACIDAVPPDLPPDRQAGFAEEVWQALSLTGLGLGQDVRAALPALEEGIEEFIALYEAAVAATSQPTQTASAPAGPDFDEQYRALRARLTEREAEFLRQAEQRLTLARPPAGDERAQRHHTYERAYWRKLLEGLVKAVGAARDEAQRELRTVEKQLAEAKPADAAQREALARQRDSLKLRASALEQRWTTLREQVDEILRKSKSAAG